MTEPQIQPMPLPTNWAIAPVQGPGGDRLVAIQVNSPTGVTVYFVPPEFAANLAQQLTDASGVAKTGLIVAPAGAVPGLVR